jgi:cytochrome c oxidase assembly protein Cox11
MAGRCSLKPDHEGVRAVFDTSIERLNWQLRPAPRYALSLTGANGLRSISSKEYIAEFVTGAAVPVAAPANNGAIPFNDYTG